MGHCEQDRLWCAAGDCICTCNRCYVARFETRNEMNAKLAAAEARADKAEAQLRSRDAEVYYLRLHREWAHDKRRQMVDAYQQWLAANPEPTPPEGVGP